MLFVTGIDGHPSVGSGNESTRPYLTHAGCHGLPWTQRGTLFFVDGCTRQCHIAGRPFSIRTPDLPMRLPVSSSPIIGLLDHVLPVYKWCQRHHLFLSCSFESVCHSTLVVLIFLVVLLSAFAVTTVGEGSTLRSQTRPPAILRELPQVSLPTSEWIRQTYMYYSRTCHQPQDWPLLCLENNGNEKSWAIDSTWHSCSRVSSLPICALFFASASIDDVLGHYTLVTQGPGNFMLAQCGLFACMELPLVVFCFSASEPSAANFQTCPPRNGGMVRSAHLQRPEEQQATDASPRFVVFATATIFPYRASLSSGPFRRRHPSFPTLESSHLRVFNASLKHTETRMARRERSDKDSRRQLSDSAAKQGPIFCQIGYRRKVLLT